MRAEILELSDSKVELCGNPTSLSLGGSWRQVVAEPIFLLLVSGSIFNFGALAVALSERATHLPMPLNPALFLASALALLMLGRQPGYNKRYLIGAWIFVAAMLGIGTFSVGDWQIADPRQAIQEASKLWIALVGIPWLGIRIANPTLVRRLFKTAVWIVALGALFAVFQVAKPSLLTVLSEEPGRGAGFWINPNGCGAMCGFGLLFSFVWPFENRLLRIVSRTVICAGLLASMSRAAVGAAIIAWFVYVLVRRSWKGATALALLGITFFVLPTIWDASATLQSYSQKGQRIHSFSRLAQGDVANVVKNDIRWRIWQQTTDVALNNWEFGCGLTCMGRAAHIGGLYYVPHNYYIFVLGTGGILALLTFAGFLLNIAQCAFAIQIPRLRALSLAALAFLTVFLGFDSSMPSNQFFGVASFFFAVVCAEPVWNQTNL